jgi:assimilatory nitrate reductase catalytic subunit
VTVPGGILLELAGNGDPARLDSALPSGERIETHDSARGARRIAILGKGRLIAALFVTRDGTLPPRDWLIARLGEPGAGPGLLAGRAPGAAVERGAIICACFDVGLNTLVEAIASQRLVDVAAVGKALGAGTNCGSCKPALARLVAVNPEVARAAIP